MARRKEIKELYCMRAIAAIGILLIHASSSFAIYSQFETKAMYLGIFINQFFRFGSPIFMMISGLVIFYNYRSIDEFDTSRFLNKKAKFVLMPYITWSILYFLFTSYINRVPINVERLLVFGKGLLLGENYSHLYFIILIFQFYLVVPLLIRYLAKPMEKNPFKVFTFFFLFQGIILMYLYYFKNPNATGIVNIFNRYGWKTIFSWSFYFMTGGLIGMHYDRFVAFVNRNIKSISVGFIITSCLYIGQVYYDIWIHGSRDYYGRFGSIRPHTMIYALFAMPILIWITRRIVGKSKVLKDFGTYSFGVYFSHPLVLLVLIRYLIGNFPSQIGYSRLSSLVLICGLELVITLILVLLIGTLEIRWLFIGKVPKYTLRNNKKECKAIEN